MRRFPTRQFSISADGYTWLEITILKIISVVRNQIIFRKVEILSLPMIFNPQAVGWYSGVPFSLSYFLEDILQLKRFKMSQTQIQVFNSL